VDQGDRQVFRFVLTFNDLNRLKRNELCTEANRVRDCFISFSSDAFEDMNGNPVAEIDIFNARQARFFIPDRNPPYLMDFLRFDLRDNIIQIVFNETFNISTFDPTQISLQRWTYNDSTGTGIPFNLLL